MRRWTSQTVSVGDELVTVPISTVTRGPACDGDGVTSSDLRLFTYRNRRRPPYPFERDL
jgi:hypothetical protein